MGDAAADGPSGTVEDGGLDATIGAGLTDGSAEGGEAGHAPVIDAAPDAPACTPDPICTTVGTTCNASKTAVVTCDRNGSGCLQQASSAACSNGACTGNAGAAACCTNSCTIGSPPACLTCTMGSNGCSVLGPVACASGLVCEPHGTAACVDPNWAEWPMPNDTTADPGAPNAMSYTDNKDGTVTDNVTGLMWQQGEQAGGYTWGSASTSGTAQNYCATLNLAGYPGWRLPSIEELISILAPGTANPSIDLTAFPGTPNTNYWSATPVAGASGQAWFAYYTGASTSGAASTTFGVRCVR
jgi:hypothetical protein